MKQRGRLLEKVAYCLKKPCKAVDIIGQPITVRDTFASNPDSKTAPGTARRWASYGGQYVPEEFVRDNEPIALTIIDLDVRSQGGRAYKVIDNDMRRFDLREDQVVEVMKLRGIEPGGKVPGTFVWGIVGSQVKLVVVGGELYDEMTRGLSDKKEYDANVASGIAPTPASLTVGGIYRKRDKSLWAFVGRVKQPEADKVSYAFVKFPVSPERYDDYDFANPPNSNEQYVQWLRILRGVALSWSALTWAERFYWQEVGQFMTPWRRPEDNREWPVHITLMGSPKFEGKEAGTIDVTTWRTNEGARHMYVDGLDNDLAEAMYTKKHGTKRTDWYADRSNDWRVSVAESHRREDEFRKKTAREYAEWRAQYQKEMTWL